MARDAGLPELPAGSGDAALKSDDGEQLALSDLINRVLDKGVVISGHVTISIAEIDLIAIDLRVLISSIQTAISRSGDAAAREET